MEEVLCVDKWRKLLTTNYRLTYNSFHRAGRTGATNEEDQMKATITPATVNGQPGFAINYTTPAGCKIAPWTFTNNTSEEAAFQYFRSVYPEATL